MNELNLWEDIKQIKEDGFSPEGLHKLELYAELFNERKLLYQRFSPAEQHGCSKGGGTHVVATLLAGAEVIADCESEKSLTEYQREGKCGAQQEKV